MPLRRLLSGLVVSCLAGAGLVAVEVATAPAADAATRIFPVPTSSAGLGRIVASPDGSMWFVEEDANKVGRITADGRITEFAFPADSDATKLYDLDVAPDGTVWVIYDSGRRIRHMRADGTTIADGEISDTPDGEQVRVAPDGTAWVTMAFDQQYIIRIVGTQIYDHPNAPACEDSLGLAHDGTPWCRQGDGLIKVAADGSGGVRYPAGRYAAYPYAIAAGPVGSIWFGRYFSGTWISSPDDGEVGYLDARTGRIVAFDTGERTAPNDLVQGPDGNMWFTSIGAAAGIGHISPRGKGALTAIGGYEPVSLTFARNGAIFATDRTNNVIIRVSRDQLQHTNVDPGEGSVFTAGRALGTVVKPRGAVKVRGNKVPLTIACPKGAGRCRGTVTLRAATGKHAVVAKSAKYRLTAGRKRTVALALTAKGKAAVRKGAVTKLQATLTAPGARPVRVIVKVRR